MAPGGIEGPKGPGGPSGPTGIDATEGVAPSEQTGEAFSLGESAPAGETAPAQGTEDPVVMEAVTRVAKDLEAGRITDMRAAVEAVLEQIVAQRYPDMATRHRERFTARLQQMLADDPGVGAQLASLIQRQQGAE